MPLPPALLRLLAFGLLLAAMGGTAAAMELRSVKVQGLDDEYGTLEQVRGIARRVPQTQLLVLDDCGHSPQRDQPEALIAAAA